MIFQSSWHLIKTWFLFIFWSREFQGIREKSILIGIWWKQAVSSSLKFLFIGSAKDSFVVLFFWKRYKVKIISIYFLSKKKKNLFSMRKLFVGTHYFKTLEKSVLFFLFCQLIIANHCNSNPSELNPEFSLHTAQN